MISLAIAIDNLRFASAHLRQSTNFFPSASALGDGFSGSPNSVSLNPPLKGGIFMTSGQREDLGTAWKASPSSQGASAAQRHGRRTKRAWRRKGVGMGTAGFESLSERFQAPSRSAGSRSLSGSFMGGVSKLQHRWSLGIAYGIDGRRGFSKLIIPAKQGAPVSEANPKAQAR